MSSDKAPQGEGIIGGLISLFWNKKASPSASPAANASSSDATKAQDYITWSDSVIKRCSELVLLMEDSATPSSKLVTLMNELDPILQIEHEASSLRPPNDAKVSTTLLALGFALLHLLSTTKTQQEITSALKVLAKVLARPEFDILQPMSSSGLYRWTPDQQKKARQYRSLLIKIHIMMATNMADSPIVDPNGSIVSVSQTLSLYPRLLAILYWRLPYVGVLIRKATTINLWSEEQLNDFSERPEMPAPPIPGPPSGIGPNGKASANLPKRGRVKADSKAPPPMSTTFANPASSATTSPLPSTSSNTTSSANSAQRSSSTGAKAAPPMAIYRPHSSSLRSAAPPAFIGATVNTVTSTATAVDTTSEGTTSQTSENSPISSETASSTPSTTDMESPRDEVTSITLDLSKVDVTPNTSAISEIATSPPMSPPAPEDFSSTALPNQSNPEPAQVNGVDGNGSETTGSSVTPPPQSTSPPQTHAPSSSDILLQDLRTVSPPPSSEEGIPPNLTDTPSVVVGSSPVSAATLPTPNTANVADAVPAQAKSNPKMVRRPGATVNGDFSTVNGAVGGGKTSALFGYKTSPPPTTIELDDDLMELMVLPKVGEVPYYRSFDPSNPGSLRHHTVPWTSWMKVCKKLGFFSSEGAFNAAPTVAASKKSKSTKPGSSTSFSSGSSTSSGASASAHAYSSSSGAMAALGVQAVNSTEAAAIVGARSLLYNWVNFHQTLVEMGPETHPSPGCIASPLYFVEHEPRIHWLTWFERGASLLFVLFFKEWVNHTALMLNRTNELVGLHWESIPGYRAMEMALRSVLHPMLASRLSMPLLDATRPLVRANPEILGWLVKYCFNQTNAHSAESINAMFSKLEMWFSELDRNLYRVPNNFDVEYFLKGLEVVLSIDHHVILARLLSFIFANAHLFRGKIRRAIIEEFFVKQHFFTLFLHWDDVVRNYYQQFLIYKTVRIRRMSHIRHGLVPPSQEALTQYNNQYATHHAVPVNRRSIYGNITTTPGINSNGMTVPNAQTTNTASSANNSSASTTNNVNNVHGITMLPFAPDSFTSGVDAEGFLLDTADDEYLHDMRLFTIVESHIRIVEDQITQGLSRDSNGPEAQTAYPKSLEIYAPRSLSEYNFYLSRYEQKYMCAKLLPMSIIQEKRSTAPKSNKPKNSD